MVNTGGPSKGCATCIRRKVRCDTQRPVCGQCQKGGRQCGGYRSAADLVFRDQSQTVAAKVRANNTRAPVVFQSPAVAEDTSLVDFFVNNFTWSNARANLFWVPHNFTELLQDDRVKLSVQCTGAMCLARLRRSPEYVQAAQKRYSKALLSLARTGLQEKEISKDNLLLAILFLGFFEISAGFMTGCRDAWTTHLNGMGLLFEERMMQAKPVSMFNTRMFLQCRNQIILNALQTNTPVPETIIRLSHRLNETLPPVGRPPSEADMLLIRLANLQAQYHDRGASDTLLMQLLVLDADCDSWSSDLPPSWSYNVQPSPRTPHGWWDVRCDTYSEPLVAYVWCKIRATQIVIHDLVEAIDVELSTPGASVASSPGDAHGEKMVHPTLRRLVTDICATVPIFYRPPLGDEKRDAAELQPPPTLGMAYFWFWPLEIIGAMKEAPPELTQWIIRCFEHIHEKTGIMGTRFSIDRLKARARASG